MNTRMLYIILSLALVLFCGAALAVQPCDDQLTPDSSQTRYKLRQPGVRCEGTYVSKVSNPPGLTLVGLTRGRLDFGSRQGIVLRSPLANREISVLGVGIAAKTYYRLDAVIFQGRPFDWPLTDVVHKRKLRAEQIGLAGYFDKPERGERIYVPVDVGGDEVVVRIIGSGLFSRAFWRHSSMSGGWCREMSAWTDLKTPAFDDEPFEIPLPEKLGPEICLEASALPVDGNTWDTGLWKIISGP